MEARRAVTVTAVLALAVLTLAVGTAAGTRVTLEENGYSGVVIGIDERVDVTQCQEVIQNLQVSPMSCVVHHATDIPSAIGVNAGLEFQPQCVGVVTRVGWGHNRGRS